MTKPLGTFDIEETEDGYLLHVGDGSDVHAYEVTPEQMAAIMETLLEMIPEIDDEEFDDEFEEDEETAEGAEEEA